MGFHATYYTRIINNNTFLNNWGFIHTLCIFEKELTKSKFGQNIKYMDFKQLFRHINLKKRVY